MLVWRKDQGDKMKRKNWHLFWVTLWIKRFYSATFKRV